MTTTTETAKLIRKELKMAFPKQKFSVRNQRGGYSTAINVGWQDGVAHDPVKQKLCNFEKIDRCQASGEILGGGNTFIFANREVSDKNKERVRKKLIKGHGWDNQELDWERKRWLSNEVWNKINKTNF